MGPRSRRSGGFHLGKGPVVSLQIADCRLQIADYRSPNLQSTISSLDIYVNPFVLPRRRDAHEVADGLSHPPVTPDHLASLVGGDGQLVRDSITPDALPDLHSFGVIYQAA